GRALAVPGGADRRRRGIWLAVPGERARRVSGWMPASALHTALGEAYSSLLEDLSVSIGGLYMARAKQASKQKRRNSALPAWGAAGMSLAMAGGASAAVAPTANTPSQHAGSP